MFSIGSAGQHNHTVSVGAADRSLDHLHFIPAQGSGQAFDITNPGIVFRPIIKT